MPRKLRKLADGGLYHIINRRVGRQELFADDLDYQAFEKVLDEIAPLYPVRIVAYCLMPNHWHLLVWPKKAATLSKFIHRLTLTHMRRWHAHRNSTGTGPLYQGRFKSFPVQDDGHFLTVARYIERNALRAKMVERAEDWPWSSLHRRVKSIATPWLIGVADWPVPIRKDWISWVNQPQTDKETEALRLSVNRGRPFGDLDWQMRIAKRLGLLQTLRDPWRPKKTKRKK